MQRRDARAVCASPLLATVCSLVLSTLVHIPANAQASQPAGAGATFRVLRNGVNIGTVTATVSQEADGWQIRGSSFIGEEFKLTVRRFEAHYDGEWRARFATMELATPSQSLVVHTAINGGQARTEIIQPDREATFGSAVVSADTIVIPDMVFSAHEALAARLMRAQPGMQLPIYVLPLGEIRLRLDSVTEEAMQSASGALQTRHWRMAFLTATRESAAEMWIANGRLVRVDMLRDGVSVIRSDVAPQAASRP